MCLVKGAETYPCKLIRKQRRLLYLASTCNSMGFEYAISNSGMAGNHPPMGIAYVFGDPAASRSEVKTKPPRNQI